MATAPTPVKRPSASRYDAQVAAHLARAERRVRLLDLAAGLLGGLALTLAFALVMVLLHAKLQLSTTARQAALALYALGAGAFLTWRVILPWRRPINPRYAALRLERTLPGAKNSVVNWVDLRDETLPPAIRGALGRRAAKDAGRADVERAISGRPAGLAGGLAAALGFVCLVAMFVLGFGNFFSLLGGVFAPLNPATVRPVVQRNHITLRQPEGGDAAVLAGTPLAFSVRVEGELAAGDADLPKLRLTYPQSKDTLVRAFQKPRTPGGDWTAEVSAGEVRDGFTYRVTAGDARTAEYRVSVYYSPAVTDFRATCTYQPYVGEPHFKVVRGRGPMTLRAWRGTKVELLVQANGAVKDATIELKDKDGKHKEDVAAKVEPDPEVFSASFELKETGKYRIHFTPVHGEKYHDPIDYDLIADPDQPPHKVELTKPGDDTRLPANGLLRVEGVAEDDIGVKSLTLRLQRIDGDKVTPLKDKPYRSDEELRLPATEAQLKRGGHGGYRQQLAYKDAVDLAAVTQDAEGKPLALKAGDELEFWLEARDACDYPAARDVPPPDPVGRSQKYRVKLTEPEKEPQRRQKERGDASREQQQHQERQDEERRQEGQRRTDEQQRREAARKEQEKGGRSEKKEPGQDGTGEKQPQPSQEGKNPDGGARQPNPLSADQQNALNELNKEEQRRQDGADNGQQSEAGPRDGGNEKAEQKGAAKGDGEPKPGERKAAAPKPGEQRPDNKGSPKPEGNPGEKDKAGKCKEGDKSGTGGQAGEGKDGGKKDPRNGSKGDGKGGSGSNANPAPSGDARPGEAKKDATPTPAANEGQAGEGKPGDPTKGSGAAQGKPGGTAQAQPGAAAEGKENGSAGKVADGRPAGEAKGQPQAKKGPDNATAKDSGGPQGTGPKEPATARGDGSGGMSKGSGQGENKVAAPKGSNPDMARGKTEPEKGGPSGADVSKIDAKNPGVKDFKELLNKLRNGDEKEVGEALRKLQEIAERSKDPAARDFAKEVLDEVKKAVEEARRREQEGAGVARREPPPEEKHPGENKGNVTEPGKETARAKEEEKGGPTQNKGTEKGPGKKQPGGPMDPTKPPEGKEKDPTQATVKGPRNPVGRNDRATAEHDPQPPPKPDDPVKQPLGTLQLEKFNAEKYRRELEDKAVAATKPSTETPPKPAPDTPEKLPGPSTGGTLPSVGGRKTDPNATTTADPVDTGRALPPPGYRKAASELTKILAEPEKKEK